MNGEQWGLRFARRASFGISIGILSLAIGLTASAPWLRARLDVSGGGYEPGHQGCSGNADATPKQGSQAGCHNLVVTLRDGQGHQYFELGTSQQAQGDNVHAADLSVTPNGSWRGQPGLRAGVDTNYQPVPAGQCGLFDLLVYPTDELQYLAGQGNGPCRLDPSSWRAPAGPPSVSYKVQQGTPSPALAGLLTGAALYLGADDNLNSGEHDGVDGKNGTGASINGPSDGGALQLSWHPGAPMAWLADVMGITSGGSVAPLAENPMPLASGGAGACADGVCADAETQRRAIYHGAAAAARGRDAADYSTKTWDPYECSSGDVASEKACVAKGGHTMDWYRHHEATNVYAEPGVQVYEDPDSQGSPITPAPTYPLPAAYVGTCGVVAGGGAVQAPASPVTNSAGQASIKPTGC